MTISRALTQTQAALNWSVLLSPFCLQRRKLFVLYPIHLTLCGLAHLLITRVVLFTAPIIDLRAQFTELDKYSNTEIQVSLDQYYCGQLRQLFVLAQFEWNTLHSIGANSLYKVKFK